MGWTKKDFVVQAFEEIGYASYIYDAMPEQLESLLRSLDSMMATWNGKGIQVGYPLPGSPSTSSLNDVTNVPDALNETIYTNLAVRIGPRFGKTIPQETKQIAKESYDALLIKLSMPLEMQLPGNTPLGAGNKTFRRTISPFVTVDESALDSNQDGEIIFE